MSDRSAMLQLQSYGMVPNSCAYRQLQARCKFLHACALQSSLCSPADSAQPHADQAQHKAQQADTRVHYGKALEKHSTALTTAQL